MEGENLDERAVPKELLPKEDEGKSLKGKWVNSHDLRAGDKIFSLSGKLETIQAVSQRFEESFAVCNLTIEEMHNYAVGHCGVLVHNTAGCGLGSLVSRVWPEHHPFPMYLGGSVGQTLKKIPRKLHYQFHASLDGWKNGKYARSWGANHFRKMSPKEIIGDLTEFYRKADGGAYKHLIDDFFQAVQESGLGRYLRNRT